VRNGATTYTMPARYGTLVGTIVMSANGQVTWTKTQRGIWNEYNRLPATMEKCPGYSNGASNTSFTTNSTTLIEANGANNGRVSFVLGDVQKVKASVDVFCSPAASDYVVTTVAWDGIGGATKQGWSNVGAGYSKIILPDTSILSIGSHYAAMFLAVLTGSSASTIWSDYGGYKKGMTNDPMTTFLTVELEM